MVPALRTWFRSSGFNTHLLCLDKAEESAKELPKLRVDYGEKRRPMANFDSWRHDTPIKCLPVR